MGFSHGPDKEQITISRKSYRLQQIGIIILVITLVIGYTPIRDYIIPISQEETLEEVFLDNIDCTLFIIPLFTIDNKTHEFVSVTLENEYKDRTIDNVNLTMKFPEYCNIRVHNFKSDFMNTVKPSIYDGENKGVVSMGDFSIDSNSSAELGIEVTWSYFDNDASYIEPLYWFTIVEGGTTYKLPIELYIAD